MKVDGACHCGAVQIAGEVDPDRVVICHCTDCQTMSGAPYRVHAPAAIETFAVQGEPTRYVKVGGSGAEIVTAFCSVCGASLFSHRRESPQFVSLRLGALRQRAELPPKRQGFCASAMPWAFDIRDLPKV